eukprot:TRINITY_DN6497_c0_g1_i1.p1 TRINITY_DN6497_c0_g1~~TRINITY_DN6497_c0_g1_i1.p1  ORF type:complete len:246 (+),score=79.45 TRINITY_DN6497_c0_g1_i1:481-1218(+)
MLCLAMKFVPAGVTGDIGDTLVYAYAAVGLHVGLAFPAFLRVWLYCMHSHCPITVPIVPASAACSEFRRADEDADALNTRVGLFMRQYAAFVQTAVSPALLPDAVRAACGDRLPPNPLGPRKGWCWLASMLNVPPEILRARRDLWTTALAFFLTKAGYCLLHTYRAQFGKMLDLIQSQYLPLVNVDATAVAAPNDPVDLVSLRVALQLLTDFLTVYRSGQLLPPEEAALDATGTGQAGADTGHAF